MSAFLKLYIDSENEELVALYTNHINKHNNSILLDPYSNSGFDLFVPDTIDFLPEDQFTSIFINMRVKGEMAYHSLNSDPVVCAFNIYPRSSISKTPLMLANHTGIIDMGYRGWLIGAFRSLSNKLYTVDKHTRLLQICHPSNCPIYVKLVGENELSSTIRGDGGFGSTGKIGSIV